MYHISCANRKNFKFLYRNLIQCCVNSEVYSDHMETISRLEKTIADKNTIIEDKITIIKDKEYIIQQLEDKIKLLQWVNPNQKKEQVSSAAPSIDIDTEKAVNKKSKKKNGKKSNVNKEKDPSKISSEQVSVAVATALKKLEERKIETFRDAVASTALPSNAVTNNKSVTEEQNWTLVQRKKAPRRKATTIEGTNANAVIKGVVKQAHLHVFRLAPETTEEQLENYLRDKNFENVTCKKIASKHPNVYSSFKVSVLESELEKIKSPEIWPQGVCVDRFLFRLQKQPSNDK